MAFPFIRSLFRRAPEPQLPAAAPPHDLRKRPRISDEALIASRQGKTRAVPIFTVAEHPPGVGPAGADGAKGGMAMDSGIESPQAWANSAIAQASLSSFWTEGTTFLGYAYLSELAQRPEYRVISETIATEMTREWIRFTATDGDDKAKEEKIAALTAEFDRLHVRDAFCRAAQQDGFFGRGHIFIDTGDVDDTDELKQDIGDGWNKLSGAKIKKGSIKALRTVEAVWCYPTSYNSNDPLKENWYRPDSWYVQAKIVHTSRLLTFIGREVPDLLKPTYSFGGLSMSQMAKPYVDNWLRTRQGVNDIINSFSQFVLMTNMQEAVQEGGEQLFKRAELFNNLRSNRGLMMLDKDSEDFKNVSAPLSGLDALQAQAQEHMAAVSHIPIVKLLGIQPAGLNADSEGIMDSFEDYVHAFQEHLFRLPLHRLMGLVMLSLWGKVDDTIGFVFEPLSTMSEKERSEIEKTKAERDQVLIDSGVIYPEESRKRVAHDPDSDFAAIDVDDVPNLLDEEEEGLAPKGGHMLDGIGEEDRAAPEPQAA